MMPLWEVLSTFKPGEWQNAGRWKVWLTNQD
jgi:hypothetical protein